MQFRRRHPWDPGYALPQNVLDEPSRVGTLTTAYLPRRTIDAPSIPEPWRTGYAYPEYVDSEPLGRGVFATAYMPRRTVDTLVPDYLSGMVDDELGQADINTKSGATWRESAARRYSGRPAPSAIERSEHAYNLGFVDPASSEDAIGAFGHEAAAHILSTVMGMPRLQRKPALRKMLDRLEPGLWGRVTRKANALRAAGANDLEAVRRALASSISHGLAQELIRAGRTGGLSGLMGLGATEVVQAKRGTSTGVSVSASYGSGTESDPWKFTAAMLDGTVRDHRLINVPAIRAAYDSAVARYGAIPKLPGFGSMVDQVKNGQLPFTTFITKSTQPISVFGRTVTPNAKYGLYYDSRTSNFTIKKIPIRPSGPLGRLGSALSSIGKALIGAVEAVGGAVKGAVEWVGEKACDLVSSDAGKLAAGAGAAAYGAPPQVGVAGADVAEGLCKGVGQGTGVPYAPPKSSMMPLLLVGGAGVAALLLLSKKKRTAK